MHKYGEIDDRKAYQDIKNGLEDFEVVVKEFENFLAKHKAPKKR